MSEGQAIPASVTKDRNPIGILVSLLFVSDELLRWRVIEALGKVIGEKAGDNPEIVRDHLRRLFWSMNDESGSVIWCAPEVIAEILAHARDLIHEYSQQLLSFIHTEPFERGVHWAVARLAAIRPTAFAVDTEVLTASMADPDPPTRAYAARVLLAVAATVDRRTVETLLNDTNPVTEYDFKAGQLKHTTVGRIVKEAMAKPDTGECAAILYFKI